MPRTLTRAAFVALALGTAGTAAAQGARQDSAAAATIRCPERFTPVRDTTRNSLRCRREEVRWVVTTCADSAYATYRAQPGPDVCLPTSLPGVGSAPGARGTRRVVCAGGATGFPVVRDRIGDRDRCERAYQTFTALLPASPGTTD